MNSKLFYKAISGFYDLIDVIYFRDYENSPRKVIFEAVDDTNRVLDLCTGTATNALKIAKAKPLTKVVGIDLSEDMLKVAMAKVRKERVSNIRLYCMDARKMGFKDKYFDKILLSLVLHEIDEDLAGQILYEAKRVLKDDGEIIVTEWERSRELLKKIIFLPIEVLEPKPYRTFVIKDLYTYFARFGLEVIEEIHCDYSKVLRLRKNGKERY